MAAGGLPARLSWFSSLEPRDSGLLKPVYKRFSEPGQPPPHSGVQFFSPLPRAIEKPPGVGRSDAARSIYGEIENAILTHPPRGIILRVNLLGDGFIFQKSVLDATEVCSRAFRRASGLKPPVESGRRLVVGGQ
jgi:hypothetical protein